MSIIPELLSLVKTTAPIVASALGSPIAGVAVSLIASAFGIKGNDQNAIVNAIKSDPDAAFKLKELEYTHAEELKKIASTDFQTAVSDKMNAREYSKQYIGFMKYMAAMVTIGFFIALFMCFLPQLNISDPEKQILLVFIGVLTSKFQTIIDYFFGSSNK